MKKKIFLGLLVVVFFVGVHGLLKPLPAGVSYQGAVHTVTPDQVHFFRDITYVDETGARQSTQEIFNEIVRMIEGANEYILVDMFLYNDFLGIATSSYRALSQEITDALLRKKAAQPDIVIQVISDPINTLYGEYVSPHFAALEAAGIPVTLTALEELRDSNPLYSAWWRTFLFALPENPETGGISNPLDVRKADVGIPMFVNTLNFKANHRKLIVADYERDGREGLSVLVTSANPHDGSSAHSNTAVRIDDAVAKDALESERAVIEFSGGTFIPPRAALTESVSTEHGGMTAQYLTERAIKEAVLARIEMLQSGDTLDMAMFYISDRDIVTALKDADRRGVKLRLIFDPNKDAFGRIKNGIPNRQVAYELIKNTVGNTEVRWCNTHGEQCHSKLLLLKQGNREVLIQGSANLTRRNLDNFNLETNVVIEGSGTTTALQRARTFFDDQWSNVDGIIHTLSFEDYRDNHFGRILWYRFGEFTGMSRY